MERRIEPRKSHRSVLFVNKLLHPCVTDPVEPLPTEEIGQKSSLVENIPLKFEPHYDFNWFHHYRKLNGKNCIPKPFNWHFWAGNNRFSIPFRISIEIFIPSQDKSSIRALRQRCNSCRMQYLVVRLQTHFSRDDQQNNCYSRFLIMMKPQRTYWGFYSQAITCHFSILIVWKTMLQQNYPSFEDP